jgi:hypothetical protein
LKTGDREDLLAPLRSSRLALAVWAIAGVVLVVGPIVVTLGRASSFSASLTVFTPAPHSASSDFALSGTALRKDIENSDIQAETRSAAGNDVSSFTARVSPSPRVDAGSYKLTASASTPDRAVRVVNALGSILAFHESAAASAVATEVAGSIKDKLDAANPGTDTDELARRLRAAKEVAKGDPTVVLGERPAPPGLSRWGDKLVDRFPGDFPPRPSPLFAGIAGLVAWLGLTAAWLVVRRRRAG